MLCILFVTAMGHPDDPCDSQAFPLLLVKMRADRNLGKKQALYFLLANPLFTVSLSLRKISQS
jgi:hypothetical protein